MSPRRVREVMTTQVVTLSVHSDLSVADALMQLEHVRHLPVVDGDTLVGLVSHRDVLHAQVSSTAHMSERSVTLAERRVSVRSVMRRDVITAVPDMPLAEAARLMRERKIGCLPVVDDGKLVGLVSESDFLRLAADSLATADGLPATLRRIAERWLACFEQRDLNGLLALYADDAAHTSPKIRTLHPETGGVLRGKDAMRAWWAGSFARLPNLSYHLTSLTADERKVFIEYVRRVPGEPDLPVAESLEVKNGLIVASQVFHG